MLHVEIVVDSPSDIASRSAHNALTWVSVRLMPRWGGHVGRSRHRAVRGVVAELSAVQGCALIESAELVDLVSNGNRLAEY